MHGVIHAEYPESSYPPKKGKLEKLKNEGLIDSKKQGKKFLYWWKGSE